MDIKDYIQSGIIESYVLGLASNEEALELERLREQHPEIQEAIDDFSLALEEQAMANAVVPPAGVKEELMLNLFGSDTQVKKDNPLVVAFSERQKDQPDTTAFTPGARQPVWRYVAAASVILLVASITANLYFYNQYRTANSQYQALLTERNTLQANNQVFEASLKQYQLATQMMADTAYSMVEMKDPSGQNNNMTVVFWNKQSKDVYLMANALPATTAGKQYQLWALVDGKPVDAGMIEPGCTTLCKMKNIPRAQAFAITLEKEGGSPVPTLEQLKVLGNV